MTRVHPRMLSSSFNYYGLCFLPPLTTVDHALLVLPRLPLLLSSIVLPQPSLKLSIVALT
ncbi:hypothetical protein Syun_011976 [Stephania yunnanensis]|uniref:Uncharacterized protein n=1 Tax=Stephania yunnanensis TaxID=152371 RepID=A0AAP0JYS1_9MAGN